MMDGMPMIAFADCITKTRYRDCVENRDRASIVDSPWNGKVKTLFVSCSLPALMSHVHTGMSDSWTLSVVHFGYVLPTVDGSSL
jgi:hypothetical protein